MFVLRCQHDLFYLFKHLKRSETNTDRITFEDSEHGSRKHIFLDYHEYDAQDQIKSESLVVRLRLEM